jgi:hypothetical protein
MNILGIKPGAIMRVNATLSYFPSRPDSVHSVKTQFFQLNGPGSEQFLDQRLGLFIRDAQLAISKRTSLIKHGFQFFQ